MRTHLAAVEGILLAHDLPDEGVTGFGLDRDTARLLDLLNGVPGKALIMNVFLFFDIFLAGS